jgi:hypothetical protein
MNAKKRPFSVILIACLYLLVGVGGFVLNLHAFGQPDFFWMEITELVAMIAGIFLLFGQNWARWLALLWMAFHVAISFEAPRNLVVHALFLVLIAWALFCREARLYFRAG